MHDMIRVDYCITLHMRGISVEKVSRKKAIVSAKNRHIDYGNLEYVTMLRFHVPA